MSVVDTPASAKGQVRTDVPLARGSSGGSQRLRVEGEEHRTLLRAGLAWERAGNIHLVDGPNLRVLKRSRKKPVSGDVLALSPAEGLFLFGRVIRADLPRERAPMPGAYLVYVYRYRSSDMEPNRAELHPGALLLSPLFINQMPWTKGYFQTVDNWPLTDEDLVAQHCFLSAGRGRYFDEDFNELAGPARALRRLGVEELPQAR